MKWLLPVLFAASSLSPSQTPPELRARFIGNMAFTITDGTTTVMTDFPYQSGYSSYMTYDAAEIRSETPATIALITHGHADHWEPVLFQRTNWRVIGPRDVVSSVPAERRLDPAAAPGGLRVEALETPHAGVGHYSYVVTWHGRRLYFTGDTESLDALVATKNLDVAFVSPWLFRMATTRNLTIDARRIVIYHHQASETVPGCTGRCAVPRQGETLRF
jgi:L-ascorbate metabolism protein UlaG (beta-lactamase superfamily)